jgi:anti-anti-sigma factor
MKEAGPMGIETVKEGEVLMARVDGRIDGTNALEFQNELEAACADADRYVILDLEQVSYISSAGLRAILMIAKWLENKDVKLALCSLSDSVNEIFQVSGFDQIISVRASKGEAIKAVGG